MLWLMVTSNHPRVYVHSAAPFATFISKTWNTMETSGFQC